MAGRKRSGINRNNNNNNNNSGSTTTEAVVMVAAFVSYFGRVHSERPPAVSRTPKPARPLGQHQHKSGGTRKQTAETAPETSDAARRRPQRSRAFVTSPLTGGRACRHNGLYTGSPNTSAAAPTNVAP